MTTANLIEIFCILDEFCKYFTPELKKHYCHRMIPVPFGHCLLQYEFSGK